MTDTENILISEQGWFDLIDEIATRYGNGQLISHDWLRWRFGLKDLDLGDYPGTAEFINAVRDQQFSYMTLVEKLRIKLLEQLQICIRNVWGEGYEVVPSVDQTRYGYDNFIKDMSKAMKEAKRIMNNVANVDAEQQVKDNDLRAKFAQLTHMINAAK